MLSFFQQDVWDEILDLMTQCLRVFLPTLLDKGTFQAVHRNVIVTDATNRRQCGGVSASCAVRRVSAERSPTIILFGFSSPAL